VNVAETRRVLEELLVVGGPVEVALDVLPLGVAGRVRDPVAQVRVNRMMPVEDVLALDVETPRVRVRGEVVEEQGGA
jgi:hypothetical protein